MSSTASTSSRGAQSLRWVRRFLAGIDPAGLALLWFTAMLTALVLTLTDAPEAVVGLSCGGLAALAFVAVPTWPYRRRLLGALATDSVVLHEVVVLRRFMERHERELRPMGDISDDLGDYLEEHSRDFEEYVKRRRGRRQRDS